MGKAPPPYNGTTEEEDEEDFDMFKRDKRSKRGDNWDIVDRPYVPPVEPKIYIYYIYMIIKKLRTVLRKNKTKAKGNTLKYLQDVEQSFLALFDPNMSNTIRTDYVGGRLTELLDIITSIRTVWLTIKINFLSDGIKPRGLNMNDEVLREEYFRVNKVYPNARRSSGPIFTNRDLVHMWLKNLDDIETRLKRFEQGEYNKSVRWDRQNTRGRLNKKYDYVDNGVIEQIRNEDAPNSNHPEYDRILRKDHLSTERRKKNRAGRDDPVSDKRQSRLTRETQWYLREKNQLMDPLRKIFNYLSKKTAERISNERGTEVRPIDYAEYCKKQRNRPGRGVVWEDLLMMLRKWDEKEHNGKKRMSSINKFQFCQLVW